MAIANKYPTIRPSLNLDFANSKTIDPRITFSRASSATYFDDKGVMRTAPAGVPRIDHDPVTGESLGLLIEEQRTNLLRYSEQFDNAESPGLAVTVTPNSIVAPDGTVSADNLFETTGTWEHYLDKAPTVSSGTVYVFSVYAKAGERNRLYLRTALAFPDQFTDFDLVDGSVVRSLHGIGNYGITSLPNGWYRLWVAATATSSGASRCRLQLFNGSTIYTGDGTSGIYIWGAQLEVGSFPTSYIKTQASQVTRAADTAVMTGTNFSDWANSAGTILAKYKTAGWKHNNTPPVTQLDLTKAVDDYSTSRAGDSIERLMFYPRQLTESQIAALKG